MDEQNCVNFVSNLACQSRRMTPGLPTRKKARISEHGKEEEEAEEKIPLTETNSSKIKAAQIKVAVPSRCVFLTGFIPISPSFPVNRTKWLHRGEKGGYPCWKSPLSS